jgi:hypothetical protein
VRRREALWRLDHGIYYAEVRKTPTSILRRLQQSGLIRAASSREIEATTLLCIFDGLGVHAATDPEGLNAKDQRAILEAHFEKPVR